MKRVLIIALLLVSVVFSTQAELQYEGGMPINEPLEEYFAAEDQNYNKSIIYIFYNGNPCYECPQTIALTEQIYNQYYQDRYSLFVIDYENDDEYDFIYAYDLHEPLSIVLVRIQDGENFGYRKISNPQNFYEAPEDYEQYITQIIDDYLGDF